MPTPQTGELTGWDPFIEQHVPFFQQLAPADQERLRRLTAELQQRGMPEPFIVAGVRSTSEVLQELREDEGPDNVFQREQVRSFMEQNAASRGRAGVQSVRKERKSEERDRLQANTMGLIRQARLARGRHEVKKTRNMLLKVDQRELRRVLGREGDDLCRQINTWLRSTAGMF
jgi:hypothetical protein